MSDSTPLKMTPAQRYMLSMLKLDGSLYRVGQAKVHRRNGSHAGYAISMRLLIDRGLAKQDAGNPNRYLPTPAGLQALTQSGSSQLAAA